MTNFLCDNKNTKLFDLWDDFKNEIQQKTIKWCKDRKKAEDIEYTQLCREYRRHEQDLNFDEMTRVKTIIDSKEKEKARGIQIRAKAKLLDNREDPSDYFVHKEVHQGKKKTIREIEIDGTRTQNQKDITTAFSDFYKKLYTAEQVSQMTEEYLAHVPKLDRDETIGRDITLGDIKEAIKQMENNKSPGPDGLTKEFYNEFIDLLGPILVKLFKQIHGSSSLTPSMKLSYITLICKNDDMPHLCKNYRPISLLNTDYKVITKVLSNRLKEFLPDLIHQDQTCSIKGRCIQDNCHYLRDLIHEINTENQKGLTLSLDQEKAFDRVDHQYLFNILNHYGFSEIFINWIKLLYNNISSAVLVNNHISEQFQITRSVRQGCPLSPLIYVLALEPVLVNIRRDQQVLGCPIPGNRTDPPKVTAYADDCKFILKTHESVEAIFKHFENYGKVSGAKLNKTKTEIMYLGRWRDKTDNHLNIKVVKEMDMFGITFGNESKSWEKIMSKIKRDINFYSKRKLSYIGKAKLVNTLILPKVWYLATIFPPPAGILNDLEKIVYRFIWGQKQDKVRRETMTLPVSEGGVGLINVKCKYLSLFLNQMMKVFNNINTPWVHFGHQFLGLLLRKYTNYNFDNCTHPHTIFINNPFYNEIKNALKLLERTHPNFDITADLNSKKFYKLLLKSANIRLVCAYRSPNIDFKTIFNNLENSAIDYLAFNTTFLQTHGVLPVAYNLHRWRINSSPFCTNCYHCNETAEHLFLHCAMNHLCKHWLLNLIFKTYDYSLTNEDFLFGFQTRAHKHRHMITMFLTEYRLSVWLCRNRSKYENIKQSPRDSLCLLKNRINLRLQADYIRLKQLIFERQWTETKLAGLRDKTVHLNF